MAGQKKSDIVIDVFENVNAEALPVIQPHSQEVLVVFESLSKKPGEEVGAQLTC